MTYDRERCLGLCEEIEARALRIRFECETRLDRLDTGLLDRLNRVGLRTVSFGVESASADTLRRVGRRPTPSAHEQAIVDHCRHRGIVTAAFYVLGFLQDDWTSIAATIDYSIELGSTFAHPNLTAEELRFLLGAAYSRFYIRPSYLADYCRVRSRAIRRVIGRLDRAVSAPQGRYETTAIARSLTC